MLTVVSLDGFLILDKPVGLTSAHFLNRVKSFLPRGTKIGHAGTLDSLASGVLVALIGKGTKQSDRVMASAKQYEAAIHFGATSRTDDAQGPIVEYGGSITRVPQTDEITATLHRFIGTMEQMPPLFSALKISGRRASDRVRHGEKVKLKPRAIRIDAIEVLSYEWPTLSIRVDCGKGTYIRSLARDVGAALGVGGFLSALRRTRVGEFTIDRAATLETIERDGVERWLLPLSVPSPGRPGKG